jgi:hypothetical protein
MAAKSKEKKTFRISGFVKARIEIKIPLPVLQIKNRHDSGSTVQGFKGSTVQGFNGSGVQRFRGSTVQGFNGSPRANCHASLSSMPAKPEKCLIFTFLQPLNHEPLNLSI